MEYSHTMNENELEVVLKGKFTFTDNKNFLTFLEGMMEKQCNLITLNLEEVSFIDSAALGILLLIRDKCNKSSTNLILQNPKGQVDQMFKISKFDHLFKIE